MTWGIRIWHLHRLRTSLIVQCKLDGKFKEERILKKRGGVLTWAGNLNDGNEPKMLKTKRAILWTEGLACVKVLKQEKMFQRLTEFGGGRKRQHHRFKGLP
jgi:hypothetical protein